MTKPAAIKIEIENANRPGRSERVDADKYEAMKSAMLAVLPQGAPGLTVAETKAKLLPLLPDALFPQGAKAGWWLKALHLDLEARASSPEKRRNRCTCTGSASACRCRVRR